MNTSFRFLFYSMLVAFAAVVSFAVWSNPAFAESNRDSDKDGIADSTDTMPFDHDSDGLVDEKDTDDDGDGYPDCVEKGKYVFDHENDGKKDKKDSDDDNDGVKDTG
jgi:hypothetical protein